MKQILTVEQYAELVSFWSSKPRGDDRQDAYSAMLRWQIASLFGEFSVDQFLPPWCHQTESDSMDAESLYYFLKELNDADEHKPI